MLPTDYRTKVLTWLAAYRNSNCVRSQNETFLNTSILAVGFAPASAAAPCSVCVQRLLQWLLRLGETVTFENMYAYSTTASAYRNSNCAHSQSETFVHTVVIAVCLALAYALCACTDVCNGFVASVKP